MRRPVLLALPLLVLATLSQAAPNRRAALQEEFARSEARATECLAQGILATPGAMAKARSGQWYEAAGVMGRICRPEVDAMMGAHDRVNGPGTGMRYFRTAYVRALGTRLAERLGPDLRKAYASAEPVVEAGE